MYSDWKGNNKLRHVVRISDGLGNQMFQYAFAYALARRTGAEVLLDPLYWGTSLRKYQLEEFSITNKNYLVSKAMDYLLGFGPRNGRKFKYQYRQYLIHKKYKVVEEKQAAHYDPDMEQQTVPSFYLGFWQTPNYFDAFYDDLKEQFTLKKELSPQATVYLQQIKAQTSVSLHIRRTDYVSPEINGALEFDFYQEALQQMQKQLEDFRIFIFTDDKKFVKDTFDLCEYTLVEGVSDLDEFELMRQCNHHITANSSFSWWATYLAEHKGGIVYAPCTKMWTKEFYPIEWNLIYL